MTDRSLLDEWDVAIPTPDVPEKKYVGRRWPLREVRVEVTVVVAGRERLLKPCGDRSVSYEWGYNGAGPTALAASLLADHLQYEAPIDMVIAFRRAVVSRLRSDGWAISSSDVASWLASFLTRGRP